MTDKAQQPRGRKGVTACTGTRLQPDHTALSLPISERLPGQLQLSGSPLRDWWINSRDLCEDFTEVFANRRAGERIPCRASFSLLSSPAAREEQGPPFRVHAHVPVVWVNARRAVYGFVLQHNCLRPPSPPHASAGCHRNWLAVAPGACLSPQPWHKGSSPLQRDVEESWGLEILELIGVFWNPPKSLGEQMGFCFSALFFCKSMEVDRGGHRAWETILPLCP